MRLLFVVDSFSGGAGNVTQILSQAFSKKNYDVSILLLNGKRVEPKHDLSGIKVVDYALGKYAPGKTPVDRIFKAIVALRKQINTINPDVIISFLTELNILCCMANNRKIPLIVSERNDPFKEVIKKYWAVLRGLEYKKADKIVVQCSNFRQLAKGKFVDKTVVIPNPILRPPILKKPEVIHNPLKIVSMGRLTKQKNFIWMIDRMVELRNVTNDFILSIYGAGEQEEELKSYIDKKGISENVQLVGYADEPYSILAESDIYLMTSDYEGFPNALSEAMAVGLPSISRCCHEGIKDLVKDGENGFLVSLGDSHKFVARISQISTDKNIRNSMSFNAQKVTSDFGVDSIIAIWEREILQICKMPGG